MPDAAAGVFLGQPHFFASSCTHTLRPTLSNGHQKRRPIGTAVEIIVPTLLFLLLWAVRNLLKADEKSNGELRPL
jgi:hypothetical protein